MAQDEGSYHQPVMVREVLEFLQPRAGTIIDATLGGGGHAQAILECLAAGGEQRGDIERDGSAGQSTGLPHRGRLLGIDTDPEAIASAQRQLSKYDNMELVNASYVDMAALVRRGDLTPVSGVLMDLGVSLHQLTSPGRGFSFDSDGPIDMRFDQTESRPTALDLIRRCSERELRDWFRAYGEEPMSGRVARVLHERRRELATTGQLAAAVRAAVPVRFGRKALARVFQALRIVTNAELESVGRGLAAAVEVLAPGGRLVVLAYHSLEDRIVKETMRAGRSTGHLRVLTPKPVRPAADEVMANPRSRSARLRAAEVVG
jgi:16S rRNA (cytosine1402-N4)-methyltransferase